MSKQHLIPKAGLRVVDPATGKPLPAAGAEVEITTYWRRRLRDGDVTPKGEATGAEAATATAPAKAARASKTKSEG